MILAVIAIKPRYIKYFVTNSVHLFVLNKILVENKACGNSYCKLIWQTFADFSKGLRVR